MCALFGFVNYGNKVNNEDLNNLLKRLAIAAEERGTDATGFGYFSPVTDELVIEKRNVPAHEMDFSFPDGTKIVIGHTRWTTQGDEKYNYNNHPFMSQDKGFIMAHNGIIRNDKDIRKDFRLPETEIETDSYIAVQLAESRGCLNFKSLKFTAEELIGTFVLTYLQADNTLYIVKGDNPLYLVHLQELGLYVYASTENIFNNAIRNTGFENIAMKQIVLHDGDIIRITENGEIQFEKFCLYNGYDSYDYYDDDCEEEDEGLGLVIYVASIKGFSEDNVYAFLDYGLDLYEIAECLFSSEGIKYLDEILSYYLNCCEE